MPYFDVDECVREERDPGKGSWRVECMGNDGWMTIRMPANKKRIVWSGLYERVPFVRDPIDSICELVVAGKARRKA